MDPDEAFILAKSALVSLIFTGAALLAIDILVLIFAWYYTGAAAITALTAGWLVSSVGLLACKYLTEPVIHDKIINKKTQGKRNILDLLSILFFFCLITALVSTIILGVNTKHRHAYTDHRARVSKVAQGLIKAENGLYHKYGRYSRNPEMDIYPAHKALNDLIIRYGINVRLSDNSAIPGQSVLAKIRIPGASGAQSTTFDLVFRDGVVKETLCYGSRHFGCRGGKWSLHELK